MAGLETAWLLDGIHTVTLLERDDMIGGHAKTVDVTVGDSEHRVDVGAQYFAQRSYPNFWKLVTSTLDVPVVPATMTIAMWEHGARDLTFSSLDPSASIDNALAMLSFTTAAQTDWAGPDRRGTGPWNTTLEQYIEPLDLPRASKDRFIYPLLAALNGTSTEENKAVAARGGVAFLARPIDLGDPLGTIYHNVRDGLQAVADAMIDQLTTTDVHVSTEIVGLTKSSDTFTATAADGRRFDVRPHRPRASAVHGRGTRRPIGRRWRGDPVDLRPAAVLRRDHHHPHRPDLHATRPGDVGVVQRLQRRRPL